MGRNRDDVLKVGLLAFLLVAYAYDFYIYYRLPAAPPVPPSPTAEWAVTQIQPAFCLYVGPDLGQLHRLTCGYSDIAAQLWRIDENDVPQVGRYYDPQPSHVISNAFNAAIQQR